MKSWWSKHAVFGLYDSHDFLSRCLHLNINFTFLYQIDTESVLTLFNWLISILYSSRSVC